MTRTTRVISWTAGIFLLLIVVVAIIIATFDWNRLKPTINQKVSTELNRPFAIRGDLGVVWERQKEEPGWRSWIPWPHVHADDIILGNPPDIPDVTMIHLPRVEATLSPLALLTKTVYLPWIKLQQPDARLIRLSEKNNMIVFWNDLNHKLQQSQLVVGEASIREVVAHNPQVGLTLWELVNRHDPGRIRQIQLSPIRLFDTLATKYCENRQ